MIRDLSARLRLFAGRPITGQAGWVIATFGVSQLLRLVTGPVLAWLLAPAILGVLTLVNTLRTGIELISDVGIGQNIVVAENGDDPAFVSTAWTIQAIRGVALFLVGLAVSWPLALWYGNPSLAGIFALVSTVFAMTGFGAPARFLMQRRRQAKQLALYELALVGINSAVTIALASIWPTAWAMIVAIMLYSLIVMASQFALMDRGVLRFRIDPVHAKTIFRFGRWIFLSSLIYFAGTNFDRLYLPMALPLALFGVYGVARMLGDTMTLLMQRLGNIVIFPAIARAAGTLHQERARIVRLRGAGLLAMTAAVALGIAGGDLFVRVLYDHRYDGAQVMLPILMAGTWFSVQATMGEAVMLGLSVPARAAAGNAAKLVWAATLLPLALHWHGPIAAVAVIALADLPRYVMLAWGQRRQGLSFIGQDAALMLVGVVLTLVFRAVLVAGGIVDGFVTTDQHRIIGSLLR